jgi:protocadherin delta 2
VPIGHTQSFCEIYSIKSNTYHRHDTPFEILLSKNESCTLNLHVVRLLDREQTPMYTIRRQLINENNFNENDFIVIQLSIVILDVNDHVPQFESEHFHFLIPENIQPGSLIGRIQAHDPDIFLNGKISYTLFGHDLIQSNNRTMFRIDKDTGELFLLDYTLDYETKREYTLMIEGKDRMQI